MTFIKLKIKAFWERALIWLYVVILADGLEITDHAIRWCRLDVPTPQTFTVKVPPGVMQDGKILDRPALAALLTQVHDMASGPRPAGKKNLVVLTLGSAPTFMHLFYLPLIERNRLEKAILLNLQMLAPSNSVATNAGWQVLTEDAEKNRFEVVGVFVGRGLMDEMVEVLRETGFVTVAAESKALSIARAITKGGSGLDPQGFYITVLCDDAGMDFMIIRKSVLCFAYTIPWREIADEQGAVSDEHFAAALTRGIRQIVNFYEQHWADPVTAAVIVVNDLSASVQAVVAANVSYPIVSLAVGSNDSVREIPVAFGAALRGISPHEDDRDVTLLGSGAAEIYQEEKVIFFLRFWRAILPVILGLLVAAAITGDVLWFQKSEQSAVGGVTAVPAGVASQLAALSLSAQHFNQTVSMVQAIQGARVPKGTVLARFEATAASSSVTITRLTLGARGTPITLVGMTSSEDNIVAFKRALISDALATAITLPLSSIQPVGPGFSFSMTITP